MRTDDVSVLETALRRLSTALAAEADPEGLREVMVTVLAAVPGAQWASITARRGSAARPHTVASTDDVALVIDELQYHTGEGPCLDATDQGHPVVAIDLSAEQRWPQLLPRVRSETPLRSVISQPLTVPAYAGASLNVYGADPLSDSSVVRERAQLVGTMVGTALTALEQKARADNLTIALNSSRTIGAAIGILMAHRRITDDEAFQLLRGTSQQLHRRVRDLAEDVVLTGELPTS